MAGPWDAYKAPASSTSGPWESYKSQTPSTPAPQGPHDTGAMDYLKNTFKGLTDKMNVENTLAGISQVDDALGRGDYSGAWDAAKGMVPSLIKHPLDTLHNIGKELNTGDYSGATSDIIVNALVAKGALETANGLTGGMVDKATDATGAAADKYGARFAQNAPVAADAVKQVLKDAVKPNINSGNLGPVMTAVMGHPVSAVLFKAAANVAKGGNLGKATNAVMDIFSKPTMAEDIANTTAESEARSPWLATQKATTWETMQSKMHANDSPAQPEAEAETPKASPDISTDVKISPKISVNGSAEAMGTDARTLAYETHQKMTDAAKNGTLRTLLPFEAKALVEAHKNGDNAGVSNVLDSHAAVLDVNQFVKNKLEVLARYAKDHNIDLTKVDPTQHDAIGSAAIAHAKQVGIWDKFGNKTGTYRGISPSTIKHLKDFMKQ